MPSFYDRCIISGKFTFYNWDIDVDIGILLFKWRYSVLFAVLMQLKGGGVEMKRKCSVMKTGIDSYVNSIAGPTFH